MNHSIHSAARHRSPKKNFRTSKIFEYVILLAAAFLRILYYGFRYFPQLDDYVQLHSYVSNFTASQLWSEILDMGLLGSRPLAGIFDLFVWGQTWEFMFVSVLVITAMSVLSAILIKNVFSRYFNIGPFFAFFFVLLPISFEAAYWMSASTRIVVGMFFAALSCKFLQEFCHSSKLPKTILYGFLTVFFQTAAFCLYEQVTVMSFIMNLTVMFFELKNSKRAFLGLSGLASGGAYFWFTSLFAENSSNSARTALALPDNPWYFDTYLPNLLEKIKNAFKSVYYLSGRAFIRGVRIIFGDGNFIYLLAVIALIVLVWLAFVKFKPKRTPVQKKGRTALSVVIAVIYAIAPVSIFLLVASSDIPIRNIYISFIGLSLLADIILTSVLSHFSAGNVLTAVILSLFVLNSTVSAVSELHDYRETTLYNENIVSAVLKNYGGELKSERIMIFNLNRLATEDQNYIWSDHIASSSASDWALTALINSLSPNNGAWFTATPFELCEHPYVAWNADTLRPEGFDRYFYYHPDSVTLEEVECVKLPDNEYEIRTLNGKALFSVSENEWHIATLKKLTVD